MRSLLRTAALLTVAALAFSPALAVAKHAVDPETDKSLGPEDGAGHYFPGQSSTPEFHGCRRSDEQWFPTSLISGQPTTAPSTHHYVTFTVNTDGPPIFTWEAKSGYRICGVEVFAGLTNSEITTSELLAWVAYKSGAEKGSTSPTGKETVMVHTPKNIGSDDPSLKVFAGKTLGMYDFQAVTVYVKKD